MHRNRASASADKAGAGDEHPRRAYALVELGDSEAIYLFLREEDGQAALEDALRDEPGWAGTLSVEPVELDEQDVSPN
jgi:hypothetical protein